MSDSPASSANWSEDPEDATQFRSWDGTQGTEHRAPRYVEQLAAAESVAPEPVVPPPTAATPPTYGAVPPPAGDATAATPTCRGRGRVRRGPADASARLRSTSLGPCLGLMVFGFFAGVVNTAVMTGAGVRRQAGIVGGGLSGLIPIAADDRRLIRAQTPVSRHVAHGDVGRACQSRRARRAQMSHRFHGCVADISSCLSARMRSRGPISRG